MWAAVRFTAVTALLALFVVLSSRAQVLARQGCVTGFNPAAVTVALEGAAVSFEVLTSSATCQWKFDGTNRPEWGPTTVIPTPPEGLTPLSGTGPATVSLTVPPNHDAPPGDFTLVFDGKRLPFTQGGNPCPLTISESSPATMPASGGTGSFTVNTSGASCAYNVFADPGVTIVSGGNGSTFPAKVTFSVPPNTVSQLVTRFVRVRSIATFASAPRVGIVQVGVPDCVTGFKPSALTIPGSGVTDTSPVTFDVLTSSSSCEWSFDGVLYANAPSGPLFPLPPPWLGYPGPLSGTGPATVSIRFAAPNTGASLRTTTFLFDGQAISLSQPTFVNTCPLTVSAVSPPALPANGGTGSFTVTTTGSSCSYAILQPDDGVTITSGASGNIFPATVTFSVTPNFLQWPSTRRLYVASMGNIFFSVMVDLMQNGPPVATDAPAHGFMFSVHRPSAGSVYESPPEPLRITNTEDPTGPWTATSSEPWLVVLPSSGTSPATASISLNRAAVAALGRGYYTGTLTLTSSVAPKSPRTVRVILQITDGTSETGWPGGVLDIPRQGARGLRGAVPVGGWAVDDIGIARVQIFRDAVPGEPPGEKYVGDGTRVRGARPDVVARGATPGVTSAGWGLMLLSNVLPNGGNGTFTISAYAEDIEGKRSLLGRTTVTFDNNSSPFPFGTIDVPGQGATVSGTINNQGWILAQPGRSIPFDGSTIRLFIDGAEQPQIAGYGFPRSDVAFWFPPSTYANANGPAAQFKFDTTPLTDGLHTIVWVVNDSLGVVEGIGSRYMNVQNGSASQAAMPLALEARSAAELRALPEANAFVWERLGLGQGTWSLRLGTGASNELRSARGARVEVALDTWWWSKGCGPYAGYLMTGDVAGPLPPGASLDGEAGVFRWLPPIEFAGTYEFVLVRLACSGREERIPLRIVIGPA